MKNQNSIGVINKIFTDKIVVEVSNNSKINHNYMGDLYIFEGINAFITIHQSKYYKFIYQVIGLYEQEKPILEDEISKFSDKLYFEAIPIGEIENNKFNFGLSKYPMIGNDVYLTLTEDINTILKLKKDNDVSFSIGTMTSYDRYHPQFSVDQLFSHHMSILGNTGSGKSTTVRKLLDELINSTSQFYNINSANFIIFDVHDEYDSIQNEYLSEVNVEEDISIPLETLSTDDWINLVQPSSGVQLPVLLNGLRIGYLLEEHDSFSSWINAYCALALYENVQTEVVGKRTKIISLLHDVESERVHSILRRYNSQFGNFRGDDEREFKSSLKDYIAEKSGMGYEECVSTIDNLIEEADCSIRDVSTLELAINIVFLFEEMKGNSQVRTYCSTLMTRIDNLIATYSNNLFDTNESKLKRFEEIVSFNKGFTLFKVSSMNETDLLFFTGYLLRTVYNIQKEARRNSNIERLFHFVFDEAHKYIKEKSNDEEFLKSLEIFEKISKEGRKFGIFMLLISQRPGELSKTVLSQCNNFILHRIRNNIDLDQMRRSIPYINESQLKRLSYLRTGSALLVGEAFSIPMELVIDGAAYGEHSKTILPSMLWKKNM